MLCAMLRDRLPAFDEGWEKHFRWRGGDVSRIENLSDAVFGFALTLLVISSGVPRTWGEMREALWQVPVFAACFALLVWVWYCHYKFFRRYGLEDVTTVAWNALLLFVVLIYVYPLKFLGTFLMRLVRGLEAHRVEQPDGSVLQVFAERSEMRSFMALYSLGFAVLFGLFVLLHWHAWRRRAFLQLDAAERLLTLSDLRAHAISMGLGLSSLAISLAFDERGFWAGMVYFLMGPLHALNGLAQGRNLRRLGVEP
jgi:hypothetical protein